MGTASREGGGRQAPPSAVGEEGEELLDVLLVAGEDGVEVVDQREALAVGGEILRRDLGEQLVPGLLGDVTLQVLRIDAGVPVEALDDALGLHGRAGRQLDELHRALRSEEHTSEPTSLMRTPDAGAR